MDHTDRLTFKAVATMVKKDLLNRTQASQAEKLRLNSEFLIEFILSAYFRLANDRRPGRLHDSEILVEFKILVD